MLPQRLLSFTVVVAVAVGHILHLHQKISTAITVMIGNTIHGSLYNTHVYNYVYTCIHVGML